MLTLVVAKYNVVSPFLWEPAMPLLDHFKSSDGVSTQQPPGAGLALTPGNTFNAIEGGLASASFPSNLTAVNPPIQAVEGVDSGSVVVNAFSEANPLGSPGDFVATINWGDNSSPTAGSVQSAPGGGYQVLGDHTFGAAGTYTVTTTVLDVPANQSVTGATIALVADAELTPTAVDATATEGTSAANVTLATFTDANASASPSAYSATIDWGDGTAVSAGTIASTGSGYSVAGTHTYALDGSFSATVTIDDTGGASTEVISSVAVTNPALAVGTVSLTPTVEGADATLTATFTDGGTTQAASAYTAAVDFGDGNTSGATVTGANGSFSIQIDHTYLSAGSYTPSVTFTDAGGAAITETGTGTVGDAPLTATGAMAFAAQNASGAPLAVATFTDANGDSSATDFTATIAWGDGTPATPGMVTGATGSYVVLGTHSYATTGTFTPAVTIQDVTSTATATGTVLVSTMNPTGQSLTASEGVAFTGVPVATFTDTQPSASAGSGDLFPFHGLASWAGPFAGGARVVCSRNSHRPASRLPAP